MWKEYLKYFVSLNNLQTINQLSRTSIQSNYDVIMNYLESWSTFKKTRGYDEFFRIIRRQLLKKTSIFAGAHPWIFWSAGTWGPLPCLAISTKEITNDELKAAKWDQIEWKCIRFDEGVYTSKSSLFLTCLKTELLSTFERYRIARSSKNDATWSPMEYGRNCGTAEIPQTPKNPWRPIFSKRFSSFSRFISKSTCMECGRRWRTWFHHLCLQGLWKAMDADLLRNSERFCQVKRALPHCQLWTALAVSWTMHNHDIMHPSARTICISICVFIYIYSIGECLDDYRCPVWRKRAHVTPT